MNLKMFFNVLLFLVFPFAAETALEGTSCVTNGVRAVCTRVDNCPSAISKIRKRQTSQIQICGFIGNDHIVCCPDRVHQPTFALPFVATTPPPSRSPSTPPYEPHVYDYHESNSPKEQQCPTAAKTGKKARDKCIEYQEQLVYPCVKSNSLSANTDYTRVYRCGHIADELIIGGVDAAKNEFPHMVLLGYSDIADGTKCECGGSVISDRFILTAAHCTVNLYGVDVKYAITGALKRSDPVDSSRLHKISRIHKHPRYKSPSKYNDIALLETEKRIVLNEFTVPACLDVGDEPAERVSATGWGLVKSRGRVADRLQKVNLMKYHNYECTDRYKPKKNLEIGFEANTQSCYGDRTRSNDTCQGDSGGPIQVKNKRIKCMYTVVGVTSYGKSCGQPGVPGIYTRVAPYVDWIESIVWPTDELVGPHGPLVYHWPPGGATSQSKNTIMILKSNDSLLISIS